jgi:hypothetical protein
MSRLILILFAVYLFEISTFAQLPKTFHFNSIPNSSLPLTNSVNDILVQQDTDTIWFGTEKGLSFTFDGGMTWTNFSGYSAFNNNGISAIAIKNNTIWVAAYYFTKSENESIHTGGGLYYSTDRGTIWHFIPQPIDKRTVDTLIYGSNKIRAFSATVLQQNITFDIALTSNTIWIANWGGMLRKSTDFGNTWTRVILPPDNLDSIKPNDSLNFAFDLAPTAGPLGLRANNNHLLFSVYASSDSTIWVGTAGGINKSTDGGISWRKFSHQNQIHSISGNWIMAISEQLWHNKKIIWASTMNADDPDEIKGVSFSEDAGETWKTTLLGERANNIAFKDSIVYIATDNGLVRSADFGVSWIRSGSIYDPDPTRLHRFVLPECFGVGVKGDTVWYAGPEGIAYTIDSPSQTFGLKWKIFRTYEPIENEKRTYAYPNPFAPDDEPVRLHFSLGTNHIGSQEVSIRIFDFAMQPVRTLLQKASRLNGNEYDEIWDGKNDNHSLVANGVYFYRIEIDNQSPLWGKILVLK